MFRRAVGCGNMGWWFKKRSILVVEIVLGEVWVLQRNTFERRDHWERIMITYIYTSMRGRNLGE